IPAIDGDGGNDLIGAWVDLAQFTVVLRQRPPSDILWAVANPNGSFADGDTSRNRNGGQGLKRFWIDAIGVSLLVSPDRAIRMTGNPEARLSEIHRNRVPDEAIRTSHVRDRHRVMVNRERCLGDDCGRVVQERAGRPEAKIANAIHASASF